MNISCRFYRIKTSQPHASVITSSYSITINGGSGYLFRIIRTPRTSVICQIWAGKFMHFNTQSRSSKPCHNVQVVLSIGFMLLNKNWSKALYIVLRPAAGMNLRKYMNRVEGGGGKEGERKRENSQSSNLSGRMFVIMGIKGIIGQREWMDEGDAPAKKTGSWILVASTFLFSLSSSSFSLPLLLVPLLLSGSTQIASLSYSWRNNFGGWKPKNRKAHFSSLSLSAGEREREREQIPASLST